MPPREGVSYLGGRSVAGRRPVPHPLWFSRVQVLIFHHAHHFRCCSSFSTPPSKSGYPAPKLRVNQFPPRSAIFSPSATTSNCPVFPGTSTTSASSRSLIRFTRLVTFTLL